MLKKLVPVIFIFFLFAPRIMASTSEVSATDLIAKMKSAQSLVRDMQADTKTTITSNISIPSVYPAQGGGAPSKGPQTMVQTGHIWQKGSDKSKVEITSPMKQITITNGSTMTIISPDTGQRITQDMSKMQGAGVKGLDQTKALDYFDLTVRKSEGVTGESDIYVISGTPKQSNQFLGRMDFFIDAEKYIPLRIAMYTPKGALMSLSEIEYEPVEISSSETAYVAKKIKSIVTMSMGSVNTEMEYENVIVNQGIKDAIFGE
jgi:outer membrane lipoprotein-sorting protein